MPEKSVEVEIILDELKVMKKDMKEGFDSLWNAWHEQNTQMEVLTKAMPATCQLKHSAVKDEIFLKLQDQEDRSHKHIIEALKIIGGSGGVIGFWQFLKWVLLKGKV